MSSVVFDWDFEPETLDALQDLRKIRRDVVSQQINEIHRTLDALVDSGSLRESERFEYQEKIIEELKDKLATIESRMAEPEVIYAEELEMYLSLLSDPNQEHV